MENKVYTCICGKSFTKASSYRAHLSHCKLYLGEDKYNFRLQQQRVASIKANNVKTKLCKEKSDKKYELKKIEWESKEHFCERCGKRLPSNYDDVFGSGRYCSKSCANTRDLSIETKTKIALNSDIDGKSSKSLNGHYKNFYCASSYELIFLVYCLDNNIKIERNKFTFKYKYNDEEHVYIPDWYLPESDTIVECKGMSVYYNKDVVDLKAKSVLNHNYIIIYDDDLQKYWEFCKEKYNVKNYKDFCTLMYE